jgi:outer membrane protein TolC
VDPHKSDVVDEVTAQVPLEELTRNPGVREAFILYEAAAAQYSVATEYYVPVITSSSTNIMRG